MNNRIYKGGGITHPDWSNCAIQKFYEETAVSLQLQNIASYKKALRSWYLDQSLNDTVILTLIYLSMCLISIRWSQLRFS